jgi:hypothetical protein
MAEGAFKTAALELVRELEDDLVRPLGSAFHWQPVHQQVEDGRPPRLAGLISGATRAHSASVRSLS